jgi:hypothetical protein
MAVVAVHAVVDIVAYASVIRVRLRLEMAIRTAEYLVVVRVRMAGTADAVRPPVVGRKPRMIERRAQPRGRRMTGAARRREGRRGVIRIGRAAVLGGVARITVSRCSGKTSVYVAQRAGSSRVLTGQSESGSRMIEGSPLPGCGCMA